LPVDPADVRKVVLEEQVALDSDKVKALRERLFGNWEMNWVGYPYAETPDGSKDSLDPTTFAYAISSREIV
jgi:hypothetical protein